MHIFISQLAFVLLLVLLLTLDVNLGFCVSFRVWLFGTGKGNDRKEKANHLMPNASKGP
jgi:hypothetical protein